MFGFPYQFNRGYNTTLSQQNITPQPAIRQQGFGGHFKDTPPPYLEESKIDNKIERVNKPCPKRKKKKKKKKKKSN